MKKVIFSLALGLAIVASFNLDSANAQEPAEKETGKWVAVYEGNYHPKYEECLKSSTEDECKLGDTRDAQGAPIGIIAGDGGVPDNAK